MTRKGDYVLGTHDEEVARLALQHRIWRAFMLEALRRAGVSEGARVVDVGAGPGFAALDIAEIVGPRGAVAAVERSSRFVEVLREAMARRGLSNIAAHELDLMEQPLPALGYDVAWCRWVASFVNNPQRLVDSIGAALKPGGRVVFHEYVHYGTWRLSPSRPAIERFPEFVMKSRRESGGEPDVARRLVGMLHDGGFRVVRAEPIVFTMTPRDDRWRWPQAFIEVNVARLLEIGTIDQAYADEMRREWAEAQADPRSMFVSPMVLELIAEKAGR